MQGQNFNKQQDYSLLFEGDRKLRTLVENLPGIVFKCKNDPKRTMLYISEECQWVTGHKPEAFCAIDGVSWTDIIHPLDLGNVQNTIQKALDNKTKFRHTYRVLDKNQRVHWVNETGVAIQNKKGTIFLEGYIQDITEQITGGKINIIRDRALDEVQNGVIISNAQLEGFPIIYVNKAFERITGYTHDEVIGRKCNFLQNDDRDQREIFDMREALKSKSPCRVEIRNYRKDGSMFWNQLSITPIRNETGEVTHFIGVQNDITEKKNLEFIRKIKNEVLEMIIEKRNLTQIFDRMKSVLEQQLNVGIITIAAYDQREQKLQRISGVSASMPFEQALDQIISESASCTALRAVQSKKKEVVPDIFKEPSWSKYWDVLKQSGIQWTCSYPLMDAENNVLGILSIFHPYPFRPDSKIGKLVEEMANLASLAIAKKRVQENLILSRKQLERYSKELEKKVSRRNKDLKKTLKKLTETNFDLITQIAETKMAEEQLEIHETILLNIAQNFPKGSILLVDQKMEITFFKGTAFKHLQDQLETNKALRINDLRGISKKNRSLLQQHIDQTLKGKHLSFDFEDAMDSYMVNTTPLFKENGEASLALLVLFNISERKRNEETVQDNLRKEIELSELKSRFISTASHEFRTPLSIILSSASLIEKLDTPEKVERRMFHLERIKSNVQHLTDLLNDFLSLTKLEEGATRATPKNFDLLELSKTLLEEVGIDKKKGQTLELECNVTKLEVYLDPKLIRYIVLNLLSNAIKYSNEGQPILLQIYGKDEKTIIRVRDQGIGIPEEEKQYIFKRFYRARNSLEIAGTGLGLHIIKSYTELMEGSLRFESEENRGSSFELELPKNMKKNEKGTNHRR
ncbi:MAG: PAS domain S-box protein [Bacteroidota bacterium]|uniref:histidine kinase n=1 Tax=Flagellimonas profundi TaxID=2915620 RepID=A0ABS3FAY3_9FLAO|nr:PAS domain S-box protein [Allomuricauda profundi]MBO0340314.1 PAS domain S-box protein [Allomuricauda profundi]MEC7771494.1 PAS domain S-box protein [Bacteroidota bacterium]